MKRWMPGLAAVLVTAWTAVAAAAHSEPEGHAALDEVLAPETGGSASRLRISATQVFYPGVPERSACRMRIRLVNESGSRLSVNALLKTFGEDKAAVDSWLVPSGPLAPGAEVIRTFSCRAAATLEVSRGNEYGWPSTCEIDGQARSPCPVELHILGQFSAPSEAKAEKAGEKEKKGE